MLFGKENIDQMGIVLNMHFKMRKPFREEMEILKTTTESNVPAHSMLVLLCGSVFCGTVIISMLLQHKPVMNIVFPIVILLLVYAVYFGRYFINKFIWQKQLSKGDVYVVKAVCTAKRRMKDSSPHKDSGARVEQIRYTFTTEFGDIFQKINPLTFGVINEQTQCLIAAFGKNSICVISIS